jgi:predicted HTH transcriptional regulator
MDGDQPDLFTAHARKGDPWTSHAAGASVRNITETHSRILKVIGWAGPMTDEEIAEAWDKEGLPWISPSGLRSRRAELVDLGKLVAMGTQRKTRSGRSTNVWGLA